MRRWQRHEFRISDPESLEWRQPKTSNCKPSPTVDFWWWWPDLVHHLPLYVSFLLSASQSHALSKLQGLWFHPIKTVWSLFSRSRRCASISLPMSKLSIGVSPASIMFFFLAEKEWHRRHTIGCWDFCPFRFMWGREPPNKYWIAVSRVQIRTVIY